MYKVRDFYNYIDSFAPFDTQEEWDNSGFLIGDIEAQVRKVAVMLDITEKSLEKAIGIGADLIVSHHPIIFSPMKKLMSDSIQYKAVKAGINIISAHTSFDNNGVNLALERALLLKNASSHPDIPMIRIGEIPNNDVYIFLNKVKKVLDCKSIRYNRVYDDIKTVAVCGGSGGSFVKDLSGVDAFITGDADHHDFLDAESQDILLIAAGHFETERIAMSYMTEKLSGEFKNAEIILIDEENPIKYI